MTIEDAGAPGSVAVVLLVEPGSTAAATLPDAVRGAGGAIDWDVQEVPPGPLPLSCRRLLRRVGLALSARPADAVPASRAFPGAASGPPPDASPSGLGALLGVTRHRIPAMAAGSGPHDVTVLRDLAEGVGTGIEFAAGSAPARALFDLLAAGGPEPGRLGEAAVAVGLRSRERTHRTVTHAIEYLRAARIDRLTVVHKGNAVKCTDGILFEAAGPGPAGVLERLVAPALAVERKIIDALCADLVLRSDHYRALLVPRLYADFVDGICAALSGRPLLPGALLVVGDELVLARPRPGPRPGPRHGQQPSTAPAEADGVEAAAQAAAQAAAVQLLRHLGQDAAADRLERDRVGAPGPQPMTGPLHSTGKPSRTNPAWSDERWQ